MTSNKTPSQRWYCLNNAASNNKATNKPTSINNSNDNWTGICNGRTNHEIGKTNIILNKFDPKTFPITISVWPLRTNKTVEINSGKDVPNATAKSDKNIVEIPKRSADFNNEKINNFAAKIKPTNEPTNKINTNHSGRPLTWSSVSTGDARLTIK